MLGLLDDVRPLNPQTKLTAQLVIATVAVSAGLRLPLTGIVWGDTLLSIAVARRATDRLQPARQHGRARGRRLGPRRGGPRGTLPERRAAGRGAARRRRRRRVRRLPAAQLPAGVDLHGRRRQPFLGFLVGGLALVAGAAHRPGSRVGAGAPAADRAAADLRHRLRRGAPLRRPPADRRTAAPITCRTGSSPPASPSGRPSPRSTACRARRRAGRPWPRRASGSPTPVSPSRCLAIGLVMLGAFLGRVGGYRRARRGPRPARGACRSPRRTAARRRRSPSTCCSSSLAYYAAYRLRFEQTYAVEAAAVRRLAAARRRRQDGGVRGAAHLSGPVAAHRPRRARPAGAGGGARRRALGPRRAGHLPLPRLLAGALRRRRRAAVPVPRRQPGRGPPDGRRAAAAADGRHARSSSTAPARPA